MRKYNNLRGVQSVLRIEQVLSYSTYFPHLRNMEVHYPIHNSLLLAPLLSQINPV